jgi:hypothetical protein
MTSRARVWLDRAASSFPLGLPTARLMNETVVIQRLQQNWSIWGAFLLGFIPTLIAEVKGCPKTRWYLYGAACALVALPLVMLPTIHAFFLRQRNGMSEQISRQRRRANALALIAEDSVRSYPSWISKLSRKSPTGLIAAAMPTNN